MSNRFHLIIDDELRAKVEQYLVLYRRKTGITLSVADIFRSFTAEKLSIEIPKLEKELKIKKQEDF